MSTVFRRAYSTKTLIPPNVAAATKVSGAGKDAQIGQLVNFYKVCFISSNLITSLSIIIIFTIIVFSSSRFFLALLFQLINQYVRPIKYLYIKRV